MLSRPKHFRFFSERVFGAWVDAWVISRTSKYVTVDADFNGNGWQEKIPVGATVYYPSGHPQQGDAFIL